MIYMSEEISPTLRHLNFLNDIIDEKNIEQINSFILSIQPQRIKYRSGTVNSNTVNSKFHLIRSFCEIFARFLSFHV